MTNEQVRLNFIMRLRVIVFCIAGLGLAGCATNQALMDSHLHPPVKVLVLESPMRISADKLESVLAPENKTKLSASSQAIMQGIDHSQQYALDEMNSVLGKQADIQVITPSQGAKQELTQLQQKNPDGPLIQQTADHIQAATGADVLLRFRITDYGLTPESWRSGYITFEVVSTLAIAGVIAYSGYAAAKAAAGAYLTQEAVEETAEGYAGFWSLDVVYRPVQIEAELIHLHPVEIVWKSHYTGLSDTSLSRLTRDVSVKERDEQLNQSTKSAVKDVISDLTASLSQITTAR